MIAPHLQPIRRGQDDCSIDVNHLRVWIGRAFYIQEIEKEPCPKCEGSGTIDAECDVCEGSGKFESKKLEKAFECPACLGVGEIPTASDCPTCEGDGWKPGTRIPAVRSAIRKIAALYSIRFKCDPREIERRILASRSNPEDPE